MIHVEEAPEPSSFDELVRQPGLNAIAQRVGEEPTLPGRLGPKIEKKAKRREDLEPKHFPPYWRKVGPELLQSYHRICAYSCLYIAPLTGASTADHFAPLSQSWERAYEWTNYRLACSIMNSNKQAFGDVMDPFEVEEGFFALDLTMLKVVPGPKAGRRKEEIERTIERLGLDGAEYKAAMEDRWDEYFHHGTSLSRMERNAPFFVRELRRQGKLRPGDQ